MVARANAIRKATGRILVAKGSAHRKAKTRKAKTAKVQAHNRTLNSRRINSSRVEASANPAVRRRKINNARAEAKRRRNSKTDRVKARGGVPTIRIIRKQPKAKVGNRVTQMTCPTVALTATVTTVAAAVAPTGSGTWITSILTDR